MSYTEEVGESLRRIRVERGLSLQDVERASEGRWKAAVIGSYERGDRNISATRLLELAEFYEVSPAELLPGEQVHTHGFPSSRARWHAGRLGLRHAGRLAAESLAQRMRSA